MLSFPLVSLSGFNHSTLLRVHVPSLIRTYCPIASISHHFGDRQSSLRLFGEVELTFSSLPCNA